MYDMTEDDFLEEMLDEEKLFAVIDKYSLII